MSKRVNAIYLDVTDQVEPFSVDESWLDVTGSRALFGDGEAIANLLRQRVRTELGVTISVGVSDNKTWAKMGSDYKKPDATTVITRKNVGEILYPLPVSDLLFVGHAAAETLRHHGIGTIGALADCDPKLLAKYLGKQGESLWRMARGLDDSPVRRWGDADPVKSIGNSTTFSRDLIGRDACHAGLKPLCESVGTRLRQQGLRCRTVTIQIKDPQFKVISRQKTLPFPTNLTRQLYREACALLDACWPERAPVRLLSVTAGGLSDENDIMPAQLSFLEDVAPDDPKQLRLEKAIDLVRERYGQGIVGTGTNEKA